MDECKPLLAGALGLPDIGQLFPDNDPANKGQSSDIFVAEVGLPVRDPRMGGY